MVVAAAAEVRLQLVVRERVRVDRLELAMRRDRRRLGDVVPLVQLLTPELAVEHLVRAREALRDLLVRRRQHALVAEAVHVRHREPAHQHPVVAGEVGGAAGERGRMNLGPVARQRARKVDGVLFPEAGSGRRELRLG